VCPGEHAVRRANDHDLGDPGGRTAPAASGPCTWGNATSAIVMSKSCITLEEIRATVIRESAR